MKVTARAPGKIIITGEHFVVHGGYALAAAIQNSAWAEAEQNDETVIISKSLNQKAVLPDNVSLHLKPLAEALKAALDYIGEKRGVKIIIDSDLPTSSGLGSSSATAVAALVAATAVLGHNLSSEEIVDLAMVSERLVHKNPSGIDVNISTYGGVLLYKKSEKPKVLKLNAPVDFAIGFSGVRRNTSKMIRSFSEIKNIRPNFFDALVNSSSLLSQSAASALIQSDRPTLGAILNFYQAVLGGLRLSIPQLDRMVDQALEAGALGAKLTGAGGGGCIIALPNLQGVEGLVESLTKVGANAFAARLPEGGVKVWKS